MKKIIIVTVNFNSEKETHSCLASLNLLITQDFFLEIVVVDNGSEKEFVLMKDESKFPVHFLRNEKNLGFTGGYNAGIEFALENSADYIMLLNNDTTVDKNLLKEFFQLAEQDAQIGLIGPKIYFSKGHEFHKTRYKAQELGRVIWYAGGGVDFANIVSFHRGVDEVDTGQYDKIEETGFVTGCCMFLRAEVLKKIGGFDNKYFLYYEDADINQRIQKAQYKTFYNPRAFLWHVSAASGGGSGSSLHDYYLTRNRMVFGMKYAPLRSKIALIRESIRLFRSGREWQRQGIKDFYLRNFGKGSFDI